MRTLGLFALLLSAIASVAATSTGCVERCQMGDARDICNAYGNPDQKALDALEADASREGAAAAVADTTTEAGASPEAGATP